MEAAEFIQHVGRNASLSAAVAQSAEVARSNSVQGLKCLKVLCGWFTAGNVRFEEVSQKAHLAAFEVLTYGEICMSLRIRPVHDCEQIMGAAHEMQSRIFGHESCFLANALSPATVFYDDLIDIGLLQGPHETQPLDAVYVQESSMDVGI